MALSIKRLLILITIVLALLGLIPIADLAACIRCDLLAQLDESALIPPRVLNRTPLYYPKELQSEMIMGQVILEVTILEDGTIGYLEVLQSIPELDSLAIANVREWTFQPAYRNEEPAIGLLRIDIDFLPEFLVEEHLEIDSLGVDLEKLQDRIEKYVKTQQEPVNQTLNLLNLPFYCENYHIISWQRTTPQIKRDQFTLIPSHTISSHIFQNYYPYYHFEAVRGIWNFSTKSYTLPVTFIEAYAGIGFLDMDYAHINLAKNNLFNAEDLMFSSSLLFQDGFWMGVNERNTNVALNVQYSFGRHRLLWNSLLLDQDIPQVKYFQQYEDYFLSSKEKLSEHSLYWDNPYLIIGLRYESARFLHSPLEGEQKRTTYQVLLNRVLSWKNHQLELQWEYFDTDETDRFSYPYLIGQHNDIARAAYKFESNKLSFQSRFLSGYGFKYQTDNQLTYQTLDWLFWEGAILKSESRSVNMSEIRTFLESDLNTHLNLHTLWGDFRAGFGERNYRQYGYSYHYLDGFFLPEIRTEQRDERPEIEESLRYLEGEYTLLKRFGATAWRFSGFASYNLERRLDYMPLWYGKTNLECRYNLLHNNAITAGLIYLYNDLYYTPYRVVDATNVLDGYLRISITELFDIQLDAKNILETESVFGYPVAGIHWNLGIRWFFFN